MRGGGAGRSRQHCIHAYHTRSRAPAQHCAHACHLIRTPTRCHLISTLTHVQHMGWGGGSVWGGVGRGTPAEPRNTGGRGCGRSARRCAAILRACVSSWTPCVRGRVGRYVGAQVAGSASAWVSGCLGAKVRRRVHQKRESTAGHKRPKTQVTIDKKTGHKRPPDRAPSGKKTNLFVSFPRIIGSSGCCAPLLSVPGRRARTCCFLTQLLGFMLLLGCSSICMNSATGTSRWCW